MLIINGNAPPIYDPKAGEVRQDKKVAPTTELEATTEQGFGERRRSPDRRTQTLAGQYPERRRRGRRAAQLLGAKTRQPEPLGDSRGRNIDTSA